MPTATHAICSLPDPGVHPLWSEVQELAADRDRLATEKVELLSQLMTAWVLVETCKREATELRRRLNPCSAA